MAAARTSPTEISSMQGLISSFPLSQDSFRPQNSMHRGLQADCGTTEIVPGYGPHV